MEGNKKIVRIVESLVENDMVLMGERFVEYFNMQGYFYHEADEHPNGIGLPFDVSGHKNWITSGKVKIVDEISFKKTAWWNMVKGRLQNMLNDFTRERDRLNKEIVHLEQVINSDDPII